MMFFWIRIGMSRQWRCSIKENEMDSKLELFPQDPTSTEFLSSEMAMPSCITSVLVPSSSLELLRKLFSEIFAQRGGLIRCDCLLCSAGLTSELMRRLEATNNGPQLTGDGKPSSPGMDWLV